MRASGLRCNLYGSFPTPSARLALNRASPPEAGNQAEPRGEIAPALEALSLADGRDKGGCDDRADARTQWARSIDGSQPSMPSSSASKRGNKYLRRQLIHGARAALPYVAERDTPLGRWAKGLASRAHRNVAIVAFANKLARIAWAVLRRGERFAVTGMPGGGIELGRSRSKHPSVNRGLREGNDGMA